MSFRGSGVFVPRIRRSAVPILLLLGALPLAGTIWTRSTNIIKLPLGAREALPNTLYTARDWSLAITAVEVRDDPAPTADQSQPLWIFYFKNTDSEPHYVSITVQCQDFSRKENGRFTFKATLAPNHKDEFPLGVSAKIRTSDWKRTTFARITVDFLSGPTG